jgi:hypothetical protein
MSIIQINKFIARILVDRFFLAGKFLRGWKLLRV